jgi:uncharacterized membrane protein
MPPNPLDAPITSDHLYRLARTNHLSHQTLEYALRRMGTVPDLHAWRNFIDHLLLLLGTALLLVGIIFFFAYNWANMTHFAKFGLLQAGVLIMAMFASWRGLEPVSGQAALLAAAVLVGALLAVYGQTYQTGADAFNLFLAWAILIIPWVLVSAFAPLWFLLLILLNISLILYWKQVVFLSSSSTELFLWLFLLNGVAMLAWEYAHTQGVAWLQNHWMRIIIFGATLAFLIIPTLQAILDLDHGQYRNSLFVLAVFLYVAITMLALWYYHFKRHDLLLLAACLLGMLIVLTTLIARLLPLDIAFSWLFIALLVIGQATFATTWLRQTAKTWQQEAL